MQYLAKIDIMPRKELLDPQGKTISHNLKNLEIDKVNDVRVGKHIELYLDCESEEEARSEVEKACKDLLTNIITETYDYELIAQQS